MMLLIEQANRDGESYGCTAVIALQLGATLYVAHAGADSDGKVTTGTCGCSTLAATLSHS